MSLIGHLRLILPLCSSSSTPLSPSPTIKSKPFPSFQNPRPSSPHTLTSKPFLLPNLISLALALSFNSPLPSSAVSSLSSSPLPTTPFTQSKFLQTGLEDGSFMRPWLFCSSNVRSCVVLRLSVSSKIRPCPSTNPGCVSTNPKSASFSFPLTIPENDTEDPIQKLKAAIMDTQKNPKFLVLEDTPYGRYMEVEVDGGGFGRDVMEFLVKGEVVLYRCIATKVTYVYPFTTALGDSKGQQERVKKVIDRLGWYAPSFDSID